MAHAEKMSKTDMMKKTTAIFSASGLFPFDEFIELFLQIAIGRV
jgi:hypothetical protein